MDVSSFMNNSALVELAFGSVYPAFAELPHCVTHGSQLTLLLSLIASRKHGGIFGDCPVVNEAGLPYSEPEDWWPPRDFILWKLPPNQNYLINEGFKNRAPAFRMVIDCETPAFALEDLHSTLDGLSDPSGYCLDYLSCMSILHQLLDKIGWAYIPLGGECGMALFIAESSRRNIVLDLTEQLTNYDVSHAAIATSE